MYFELDPDAWHGGGTEGLWAEQIEEAESGEIFRLLNSPFYAIGVSYRDVIRAVPSIDGGVGLSFAGVVDRSGHSTYMILCPQNSADFQLYWLRLEALGCTYEGAGVEQTTFGERELFSVDVPKSTDVYQVYEILEEGEKRGIWIFQEGHCGHPVTRNANSGNAH